jgi:hypothetical protein
MKGCNLLGLLLIVALVSMISSAYADACLLEPTPPFSDWVALPSVARACFNGIALNESTRISTMEVVRNVMTVYSFSDIVQTELAPYNLAVRPRLLFVLGF